MKTPGNFIPQYLRTCAKAIQSLNEEKILGMGSRILQAYAEGRTIFIAGNGGSAALSSHLACDLSKTVCGANPRGKKKRLRVISLNDNISVFSAWANDEGYEHVFSEQIKNLAEPGDVLIAISSSGNSKNIINAIEIAKNMGLHTMAWVGFDGGAAFSMAHDYILVENFDYGVVESTHDVLCHMVTAWVAAQVAMIDQKQDSVVAFEPVALAG